jgi:hypothetical protein
LANEQISTTQLANVLETQYEPTLSPEANEAFVIAKDFKRVSMVGNSLNIGKVAAATAVTLAGTSTSAHGAGLTYEQDTEAAITVSPTFTYAGFQLTQVSAQRFMRSPQYQAKKKQQLLAALRVEHDTRAGALGPNLSTNVVGGGASRITKTLVLQGMAKLRAGAKEYFQMGGLAHLVGYHLQFPDLFGILDITSAEMRGDATNPNVTGRIVRAWGLTIDTSGNISLSGSVANNMLWIPEAFALGYNQEPTLLEPQKDGLVTRVIAHSECGMAEVWDEYAVNIQTSTN